MKESDYKLFLQKSIERNKVNPSLEKAIEDAHYQNALYTGKDQDSILLNYRQKEQTDQKKQRSRITITRTKHVCRQTENILNQLQMMDSPMLNVLSKSENITKDIENFIYSNNLLDFAFNKVKHYGALTDANAFLKCSQNEFGEIEFQVVTIDNVYDIYSVNDILKAVVFRFERKGKDKTYNDYELYYDAGYYIFTEGDILNNEMEVWNGFSVKHVKTNKIYAFPLGYINDPLNKNTPTKVTIIESASELFKSLIWQGSELDVTIATQGINKQFSFAPRCKYVNRYYDNENDTHVSQACVSGYIYEDNHPTGATCPSCNGTGLQIHISNQDIITFPMPDSFDGNPVKLADLVHTIYVSENAFNFLKADVSSIKKEIMATIFNHSEIASGEIQIEQTATKSVIDLQGIYATLNLLGKKVSDCFIWMCECYANIKGYKDVSISHGYTLTLKLETIEDLAEKRKRLIDANAPLEIIRAIDLAMMQKRHIDDPNSISRYAIWEQYKPFPDKTENSIISLISSLPATNRYRVMYMFWGNIKRNIEMAYSDKFYEMTHEQRIKLIDAEVEKIRAELLAEQPQMKLNAFDNTNNDEGKLPDNLDELEEVLTSYVNKEISKDEALKYTMQIEKVSEEEALQIIENL